MHQLSRRQLFLDDLQQTDQQYYQLLELGMLHVYFLLMNRHHNQECVFQDQRQRFQELNQNGLHRKFQVLFLLID